MSTPPNKPDSKAADKEQSVEKRIADLEAALKAAQAAAPLTTLPEHSAGVGLAIAPTWSLAEQEAATEAAVRDT